MADRGLEREPSEFDGVEIHSEAVDMRASGRKARPPFRLSLKQLSIAFCLAIVGGATFAMWTKPVPAPPSDAPLASTRPGSAMVQPPRVGSGVNRADQDSTAPRVMAMSVRRSPELARVERPAQPPVGEARAARPTLSAEADRATVSHTGQPAPLPTNARANAAGPQVIDRDDAPSFDCRYAHSSSERMVCEDPSLALADRVLDQSYERAIASGVPRRMLRAEQDDWLTIRENAAHYSRKAVADVYAERIGELRAMADERTE